MNNQDLLDRLGGDTELLNEVIGLFTEDCPSLMAAIRSGLAAADAQAVNRAAHQLKGSASNFDAPELTALAQSVESLAKDGNLAAAHATLPALQSAVDSLLAELAEIRPVPVSK